MPEKRFNLLKELKRRNVYRVATVYAIAGWLVIQIADVIFPYLGVPDWVVSALIVIVLIGFPVALVLAWIFEMSPQGIVRTSSQESENNPLPGHKKKPLTGAITIGILVVLLIGQFVYFSFIRKQGSHTEITSESTQLFPSNSIAVLPFVNMSVEKDNQYFSDGVMEAVLNNLSMIRDLKVVSRTSVEKYRGQEKSIREIAGELEVANILEGSVQRIGDQVRVTAQLISAENDEHLWADSYDRQLTDIFLIQSEIAEVIAENLEVIMTTEELDLIKNSPTSNLKAYELFLKANHMSRNSENEVLEQINVCDEAIKLDPDFSAAYSLKGDLLSDLAVYGYPRSVYFDSALNISDIAIQKNDRDWSAYMLKAKLSWREREWLEVEKYLNKVDNLIPNSHSASRWLGVYYIRENEYEKAIDYLLKAASLNAGETDPDHFDEQMGYFLQEMDIEQSHEYFKKAVENGQANAGVYEQLLNISRYYRDYDNMIYYALEMRKLRSGQVNSGISLAESYFFKKDFQLAEQSYQNMLEESASYESDFMVYPFKHRLGYAKLMNGKKEEGIDLLVSYKDTLLAAVDRQENKAGFGEYYDLAIIYASLGKSEKAYNWLRKARDMETDGAFYRLEFLISDPMLDNLRDDPVFQSMLDVQLNEAEEVKKIFYEKLGAYHKRDELKWLKAKKV